MRRGLRRAAAVAFASISFACIPALLVACAHSKTATTPTTAAAPSSSSMSAHTLGPEGTDLEALTQLATAPWGERLDKRRTFSIAFPDAAMWTHVKFFGVTTLAGWRYGDDHHAVTAAFVFDPPDFPASIDGCAQKFAEWGLVRAHAFDLDVGEPRVSDVYWPGARGGQPATVRVFVLDAQRRSVFGVARYPSAWAVYPAWTDACLVVGLSVPEGDTGALASRVRDRLVRDTLPSLVAKPGEGQKALEAKIDVD
jgi:hypothetical protein